MGVHRDILAQRSTKQSVNRVAGDFARNVPKRDIDPAHGGNVGHKRVLSVGHRVKMALDRKWILSNQIGSHHVDANPGGRRGKSGFPVSNNARVGLNSDERTISEVVETHGLNLCNFDLAGVRRSHRLEVRQRRTARHSESALQKGSSRQVHLHLAYYENWSGNNVTPFSNETRGCLVRRRKRVPSQQPQSLPLISFVDTAFGSSE